MKEFSAEIEINATPEVVWAVLTNAASYPEWDPNMKSIEGTIGPGEKLVLHTTLTSRAFTVTVSELTPSSKMVWKSGMPIGLFKGERTFLITPRGEGVHFSLKEVFSGLLSPIFGRFIPNLNPSFDKFARGLKARVEEDMQA